MYFFQKFPRVINGQIWFILGQEWKEEEKILSRKKSENLSLKAQKEGCKKANVYTYSKAKVDFEGFWGCCRGHISRLIFL